MPSREPGRGPARPARFPRFPRVLLDVLPALLSIAAFLMLWQAAAARIGSPLILPSPPSVFRAFFHLASEAGFRLAVGATALRVLEAFTASFSLGLCVGILAGLFPAVRAAVAPFMAAIRSIPVLAVIVLLLIWFREGTVPVVSAFLMAFPLVEASVAAGVKALDGDLSEMARVFRLPLRVRIGRIVVPSLAPFLASGSAQALSVIWKVVVAGEILSQPRLAIGTALHEAKVYLETPRALAWALAILILCALTEAAFGLVRSLFRRPSPAR